MRLLTAALLLCLPLAAPAADPSGSGETAPVVEFRLLGKGKPVAFVLDKTNQWRSGKEIPVPGSEERVFAGTIVTLKPTLTDAGDIAYEGTLEMTELLGFEPQADGSLAAQLRSESAPLKGELANHAAMAVSLPKLGRTVYFALDDPARPKKDCAACGPRDKGELAKPSGS